MNIRHFWAVLACFFSPVCWGQSSALEPLSDLNGKRPNWTKDVSEVAYVASRCGALYGPIGSIMAEKGGTKQDKESGEDLIGRGLQISLFGFQLARDNGWATEKLMERQKALSDIYWRTISSNRVTHNNMFHGIIEGDYKFCAEFERIIRAVAKTVK